jgi:hypothetical protein
MGRTHLVVDGSNIATEGRTAPSLAQLDEAVRQFVDERPYEQTIVIVDATFGHRIDSSESAAYEDASQANELITPPAGTIGRGDAFILEVARRAGADVLSNDSFQELHAEHPWIFEPGRLWGGKPVPAVGWVFVARAPVRGATSRKAVQAAKQAAKQAEKQAEKQAARKAAPAAAAKPAARATAKAASKPASKPAKETTRPRKDAARGAKERQQPKSPKSPKPHVNEQLTYATFVVNHPIGSTAKGIVDRFSSHGAYVRLGSALGYVPLKALGDPPPRSAREILTIGEERTFKVLRFDPSTRGIDVVPDGIAATTSATPRRGGPAAGARATAGSPTPDAEEAPVSPVAKKSAKKAPARKAAAKKTTAKKTVARKAPAKKKATAKKATVRKSVAKKAPARKTAAKKAPAKKSAAKKSTARKAPAKKKATARKAPAKKR